MQIHSISKEGVGASHQLASDQDIPFLICAKQLARILRISLRTLDELDKRGELPASLRVGHARRWRPNDIEEWISSRLKTKEKYKVREKRQEKCCF